MKVLLVVATNEEIFPVLAGLNQAGATSLKLKNAEADILITGAGMTATAFEMGKALHKKYDAALNIGLAGSFFKDVRPGAVVHVTKDTFSEAGAEDGDEFIPFPALNLVGPYEIINDMPWKNAVIDKLPIVHGVTVNTVHGNESSIEKVFLRHNPFTESMEGAAFMYACQKTGIPYAQVRAVSNYVERRNKEKWEIPLALKNLTMKTIEILNSI